VFALLPAGRCCPRRSHPREAYSALGFFAGARENAREDDNQALIIVMVVGVGLGHIVTHPIWVVVMIVMLVVIWVMVGVMIWVPVVINRLGEGRAA
jgi:hypothetical protein